MQTARFRIYRWPGEAVRTLDPSSLAMVMATGIVSMVAGFERWRVLSLVLLWLASAGYAALTPAYAWRVLCHPEAVRADLADPARGPAFLTVVAATDVVGTRLALAGQTAAAVALLGAGVLAFGVLAWVVPYATLHAVGPRGIGRHATGIWFLWAVASQSVAVLCARVAPSTDVPALACWAAGVVLYLAAAALVAARLLRHPVGPAELTPPYWVAMGATAISVVAGTAILHEHTAGMVHTMVEATSLALWGWGTLLIPALLAAGWWRHIHHRIPLTFHVGLWSIVFPLGMYALATHETGTVEHLPLATGTSTVVGWIAVAAWGLTFTATIAAIYRKAIVS